MMRILYVTTRQWNPGDEFILAGCRRILDTCRIQRPVEAIYNKSPQTTSLLEKWNFWKRPYLISNVAALDFAFNITHYDNSFKRSSKLDTYDAVIFAGSPGWAGGRIAPLMHKLEDFTGKIAYLGIGTPNRPISLNRAERQVMQRALVTCRDQQLVHNLANDGITATYLPCPALLSAPFERDVPRNFGVIGLGFNTTKGHRYQRMNEQKFFLQNRIFETVLKRHKAKILCHYIDEVDDAAAKFGKENLLYCCDARDYPTTYAQFDYVISSRVHGCGMASSLGIPNALIGHDARAKTVAGFLSETLSEDTHIDLFLDEESSLLASKHERLLLHKGSTMASYADLMKGFLAS